MKNTHEILDEILECLNGVGVPNLNWVNKKLIVLKASLPTQNKDYTSFESSALYDWNGGIEVAPVRLCVEGADGGESWYERIENVEEYDQATHWSVYLHQYDGGVQCVADLNTREQAEEFEGFLKSLLTLSLPSKI